MKIKRVCLYLISAITYYLALGEMGNSGGWSIFLFILIIIPLLAGAYVFVDSIFDEKVINRVLGTIVSTLGLVFIVGYAIFMLSTPSCRDFRFLSVPTLPYNCAQTQKRIYLAVSLSALTINTYLSWAVNRKRI